MVIKATNTSQSKRFRRRGSTTRSILRRRRISRRVRKCCRVRRKGTMGGARKERVGDRQQLGVELRPVRKCGAGGGRHRVGGDDTVTIGSKVYTVKGLTEDKKLVIQTHIDRYDLVITSTSEGNLKDIIPLVWGAKIQSGFVTDPLNRGDDTIQVETDDGKTYTGTISVVGDRNTFVFITSVKINSISFKIKVEKECIITYLTEYPDTLHKIISNKLIPTILKLYNNPLGSNKRLHYTHLSGHNAETVCEEVDLLGFRNSKLIIRWKTHSQDRSQIPDIYGSQTWVIGASYHALAYFEKEPISHSDNDISIAIETVIDEPYKLQLYVGTKTEMKIILTTRYMCNPSKICYTLNCKQQWNNVNESLFDS